MKRALALILVCQLAMACWQQVGAQNHIETLYDSTSVFMEESGLSHVENHQRIKAVDWQGCKQLATIKVDYDPQSAYVEFRDIKIYRNGSATPEIINLENVCDYVAPARLIYWGASQKMIELGHLNPGDEVEYKIYRKGFTYALLQADDDSRYIPPMRGHFYDIVPFWSEQPINQKVYQLSILKEKNVQFKIFNGTLEIDSVENGDRMEYKFVKNNITPIKHEPNMVANNDVQCKLILTTSPNWEAKSKWFYGVNEDYGSFKSTPELKAKVNELLINAKNELDSISILTHWVADNMRYAGISMGDGEGFTLHNAQMNFTDLCGVCKDKAGLLVAMLRAAGFESYAAMTMAGERIEDIPADQFNHSVTVVKRRNGQLQPLDPTWVPNLRELWSSAEQQQGYLPGTPNGSDLQITPISPAENHYVKVISVTEIDKKGNLKGTITLTAEGQSDASVRSVFNARKSEWLENLDKELKLVDPRAIMKEVRSTNPEEYLKQPIEIVYSYEIPQYAIVDGKEMTFIPFSARNFFARAMSHLWINTNLETRQYGFTDRCSRLVEINETIHMPKGYTKAIGFPQDKKIDGKAASFESTYALDENVFIFSERISLNKRVYEAADWPEFRTAVKSQLENSTRYITISK